MLTKAPFGSGLPGLPGSLLKMRPLWQALVKMGKLGMGSSQPGEEAGVNHLILRVAVRVREKTNTGLRCNWGRVE